MKGTVHLIPNALTDEGIYCLPEYLKALVSRIKVWYVEDLRSARRYLKKMNRDIVIDDLQFYLLNEHQQEDLQFAPALLKQGIDIGVLSESGCPGVADPGNALVSLAHTLQVTVKPHTGPNSILLTLMASGFNGQHFRFHGYLPNKQPALTQKILELERESRQQNCSQFFIETPYRNLQLLGEIIKCCHPATRLCLGINLTAENEKVISMPMSQWKQSRYDFHKQPAVFGLYAGG